MSSYTRRGGDLPLPQRPGLDAATVRPRMRLGSGSMPPRPLARVLLHEMMQYLDEIERTIGQRGWPSLLTTRTMVHSELAVVTAQPPPSHASLTHRVPHSPLHHPTALPQHIENNSDVHKPTRCPSTSQGGTKGGRQGCGKRQRQQTSLQLTFQTKCNRKPQGSLKV